MYLIFRKKQAAFFSIERVFEAVMPFMKQQGTLHQYYLPYHSSGLQHVLKNILSVRKLRGDLFHVTGDVHYAVLGLPSRRTILTVHDTVFMQKNSGIKRKVLYYLFLKWPVAACAYVTAISEKTKAEIVQYTKCDPSKIIVIPNPVTQAIRYEARVFNKKQPVVLFIGATPNKNLFRVIEALEGIDCRLKIIGTISGEHEAALKDKKVQYETAHQLSDEQLAQEYIQSDIVLFPSTYEGFGLPILEAQQTGRVVITSNISPMQEIAGAGAKLVDPFSVDSIRQGLLQVIDDAAYRETLIAEGLVNVRKYSADVIARQYTELYKKILLQ